MTCLYIIISCLLGAMLLLQDAQNTFADMEELKRKVYMAAAFLITAFIASILMMLLGF